MLNQLEPKKMGKNKEEKKRKRDVLLESTPVSVPKYETVWKDELQTSLGSAADVSRSLESSSVKCKKKKDKCKHLERVETDFSTEQFHKRHQRDGAKEKMKLIKEEVNPDEYIIDGHLGTEEPQKKRKKTKEGNEAEGARSNEPIEEAPVKKKKKLKENNELEEEFCLKVVPEKQSNEKLQKKSKGKQCDSISTPKKKKLESVSMMENTQTSQDYDVDKEIRTRETMAIDINLLNEMKEFVPNIESLEATAASRMIKYDLPRYKEFKQLGISLNHGRFTAKENERLKKNVRDFMLLTAIDSTSKLFFTQRFTQERYRIRTLKRQHKFFERIAEGIPRSCYYVYARARKMFDEQNYQGEFSKEELHALIKLHTLFGNNWTKISELTGRSAISIQKRYAQLADKEGPWSEKEMQRLLRAVRDHIMGQIPGAATSHGSVRVMKETLYKRLPLQKIAMKVKTRSWSQCREKWMGILAGKMSCGTVFTEKKSLDVQVKLIKRMYEMELDDAANVDWEDLTALIGDVPPKYVQRKWHRIKVCHVPDFQTKCFADIVDFLYENVLPELEKKLVSMNFDETQHTGIDHESYLLSDIFQDINEDNVDEDDSMDEDDNGNKNKYSLGVV